MKYNPVRSAVKLRRFPCSTLGLALARHSGSARLNASAAEEGVRPVSMLAQPLTDGTSDESQRQLVFHRSSRADAERALDRGVDKITGTGLELLCEPGWSQYPVWSCWRFTDTGIVGPWHCDMLAHELHLPTAVRCPSCGDILLLCTSLGLSQWTEEEWRKACSANPSQTNPLPPEDYPSRPASTAGDEKHDATSTSCSPPARTWKSSTTLSTAPVPGPE